MDEELISDDLMPLDSSVLQIEPPEEQTNEISEDRAAIMAAGPVLDGILDWFDSEITLCDTIDGLDPESNVPLSAQIIARQLLKSKLSMARDNLENRKSAFITG